MVREYENGAGRQSAYRRRKRNQKWNVSQDGLKLRNGQIPVLRYFGSKWRLAPWVIEHFPAHTTYVEPFAGSASVLLRKHPSQLEVLSDLNLDLINFWQVVRHHPRRLGALLNTWGYSKADYERACHHTPEDPIEQAVVFYVRNWLSFGSGTGRWKSGYRHPSSGGALRNFLDPHKFIDASQRLSSVTLLDQNAIQVIQEYDGPDTLFYVDPPYVPSTRYGRYDYSHEMTAQDHIDLLTVLRACRGKVILSGYPSELYRHHLREWRYLEKSVATRGTPRTEALWISPNVDLMTRLPLFQYIQSNK